MLSSFKKVECHIIQKVIFISSFKNIATLGTL